MGTDHIHPDKCRENVKKARERRMAERAVKDYYNQKQAQTLEKFNKEFEEDRENPRTLDELIDAADIAAVDFLRDAAAGLVPGITPAQRMDAAKQIRTIKEKRDQGQPSNPLKSATREQLHQMKHARSAGNGNGQRPGNGQPVRLLE